MTFTYPPDRVKLGFFVQKFESTILSLEMVVISVYNDNIWEETMSFVR